MCLTQDSVSESSPNSPVRVFLSIGNRLLREALVRLFRKKGGFQIAGQSGHEQLLDWKPLIPICDVLVIDGFDTDWCVCSDPSESFDGYSMKVLLIGMDDDPEQFFAAVKAGITGYLLKDASACDVVTGVRAASRAQTVCPPNLAFALFRRVAKLCRETVPATRESRPDLTLRQQQLVALVAKGLTNKEIACRLNLSEFTVRNHIHRIFKQVDAGSRSEAVETIRAHGYPLSI
jgi:DNA-binding NarL/FixJ family response regulator